MGLEPESLETVVRALLPIVVTLLLGYFAGLASRFRRGSGCRAEPEGDAVRAPAEPVHRHPVDEQERPDLRRRTGRAIAAAVIVPYAIAFVVAPYAFRIDPGRAALIALAIGVPAVPFVGTTLLEYLFGGSTASILVTAAALSPGPQAGVQCLRGG